MTSYINRHWRDSSVLSYFSPFHRMAWGKSWAGLAVVIGEMTTTSQREGLLTPACVGARSIRSEHKCVECQGPRTAFGCQVGTVLLMELTCETEEHRFLFNVTQWGSGRLKLRNSRVHMNAEAQMSPNWKEKLFWDEANSILSISVSVWV